MEKIRVLIIEDDRNITNLLKDFFKKKKDVEISSEANDGIKGIKLIKKNNYDLILLDLIMPNEDGISVLEEMKKLNIEKKVIIASSFNSQEIFQKMCEFNISYYFLKPYDLEKLYERIKEVYKNNSIKINYNNTRNKQEITMLLHKLGIPSHIKGYAYLRKAISIVYDDPHEIKNITKKIYPLIARHYNTTPSRVESDIRHAIVISFDRGNWCLIDKIFGNSIDINKAKPTNAMFIATIADKIRLENNTILNIS
ncbi:MAG: sporulation transcription factor Spo0A [Bacilli bacterium]|nr:sporulation transcription factor Spo0A [Bacilli bacterium]